MEIIRYVAFESGFVHVYNAFEIHPGGVHQDSRISYGPGWLWTYYVAEEYEL